MKVYVVLKLNYEDYQIASIYRNKDWAERKANKLRNFLIWNKNPGKYIPHHCSGCDYKWVSILEKEVI